MYERAIDAFQKQYSIVHPLTSNVCPEIFVYI